MGRGRQWVDGLRQYGRLNLCFQGHLLGSLVAGLADESNDCDRGKSQATRRGFRSGRAAGRAPTAIRPQELHEMLPDALA